MGGCDINVEHCLRPFDAAQHQHALENLLSLASFGGQGFTRLAKSTSIRTSMHRRLIGRLEKAGLGDANYLDALTNILVKSVKSESFTSSSGHRNPRDQRLHAVASDLLQILVSKGDLDLNSLEDVRDALVARIFICVHTGQPDLQNKLLHVLHTTLAALGTTRKRRDRRSTIGDRPSISQTIKPSLDLSATVGTPTMVQLLCDGITKQKVPSSALLHHWVDFLLMTLPHFKSSLNSLLLPLLERILEKVEVFIEDLEIAFDIELKGKARSRALDVNEADFAVLLNALERLFVVALEEARNNAARADESAVLDRPQTADSHSGGFLGYISTALGTSEGGTGQADSLPKVSKVHHLSG